MSAIQGLNNLIGATRTGAASRATTGLKPYLPVENSASIDFRRARSRLVNLYRQLETLAELANIDTRFRLDLPDARSSAGLGLDLTHTAATLNSTEEINASPMSFAPFGPEWNGTSTAEITIGGEYDGSHGTGTLTFEVRRPGIRNVNNLRIRVEDPEGSRIRNVNVRANHALDRQYDLRNGLYLTLGPGALVDDETATIQVFDNVGAVVDPDKPLGGVRNDNPNLQFGAPTIVAGSFQLNGENINVATSDTINDVINRINTSNAGVTATFNAASEQIDFLQNTLGSVPTIDLQGDTSNFLEATKLDGAAVAPGIDPDTEKTLDSVAAFSSVQNGNIVINGTQIAIDTANDSLDTVLARINASGADVNASFDANTQRVVIEADEAASQLVIDSNGTNFFAALNIVDGRVDPEALSSGISRKRSYEIADATTAAFAELSYLFRDSSFLAREANTGAFRGPLESALRAAFGDDMTGDVFGLRIDGSTDARRRGDFAGIDRHRFTQSLQLRGDAVKDVLSGQNGENGLVPDLLRATRQALTNVNKALGITGTFVDTFA